MTGRREHGCLSGCFDRWDQVVMRFHGESCGWFARGVVKVGVGVELPGWEGRESASVFVCFVQAEDQTSSRLMFRTASFSSIDSRAFGGSEEGLDVRGL